MLVSNDRVELAWLSLERAKAAHLWVSLGIRAPEELPSFLNIFIPHTRRRKLWKFTPFCRSRSSPSHFRVSSSRCPTSDRWSRISPCMMSLSILPSSGDRSLQRADLLVRFLEPHLRISGHRAAFENQLQVLRISWYYMMDGKALLSSIALSEGAELEVSYYGDTDARMGAIDVLSGISITHPSNLSSPTSLEYHAAIMRRIRLLGQNGTVSLSSDFDSDIPFAEFPRPPLSSVRRFYLDTYGWELIQPPPGPRVFHHLSSFPALEIFTVGHNTGLSHPLLCCQILPIFTPIQNARISELRSFRGFYGEFDTVRL